MSMSDLAWEEEQRKAECDVHLCEIDHLQRVNADLLAALERGRQKLATYRGVYPGDTELRNLLIAWDAAIAKARGTP